VAKEIVAIALACLTTVPIRLATLVLAILSSLMTLVTAVVVMFRLNDASRGQEASGDQRVQWKAHKHGLAPLSSMT
jgi:hypothetical protein